MPFLDLAFAGPVCSAPRQCTHGMAFLLSLALIIRAGDWLSEVSIFDLPFSPHIALRPKVLRAEL